MSQPKTFDPSIRAGFIRRGRGDDPQPIKSGMDVLVLKGCPDCDGRGWFLINPFATGGTNGAGGLGNMSQCLTCLDSHAYYEQHDELPSELAINSQISNPQI